MLPEGGRLPERRCALSTWVGVHRREKSGGSDAGLPLEPAKAGLEPQPATGLPSSKFLFELIQFGVVINLPPRRPLESRPSALQFATDPRPSSVSGT